MFEIHLVASSTGLQIIRLFILFSENENLLSDMTHKQQTGDFFLPALGNPSKLWKVRQEPSVFFSINSKLIYLIYLKSPFGMKALVTYIISG